jgi:hypothetical protein
LTNCDKKIPDNNVANLDLSGYVSSSMSISIGLENEEHIIFVKEQIIEMLYGFQCYLRKILVEANAIISKKSHTTKFYEHTYKSFKLKNFVKHQNEIAQLFKSLQEGRFISNDTNLKIFDKVFKGVILPKKITWIGYQGDLVYFIRRLKEKEIIIDPKHDIWKITSTLFLKEDGCSFSQSGLKGSKSTKNKSQIDMYLNSFE